MKYFSKYKSWGYENFVNIKSYINCLSNIEIINNDIFLMALI